MLMGVNGFSFSQDSTDSHSYEVGGSLSYSFSHLTQAHSPGYPIDAYRETHTWEFRPSLAFPAPSTFQLKVEPRYTYTYTGWHDLLSLTFSPSGEITSFTEGTDWMVTQTVGINLGPVYNVKATELLTPFLGVEAGIGWTRRTYAGSSQSDSWKKPEVSFPIVIGGAKIFFSDNWAVLVQLQYSRITNYFGRDSETNYLFNTGIGLIVLQ